MQKASTASPSQRELRSFGLLVGSVLGSFWLYRYFAHRERPLSVIFVASVLMALGACCPTTLLQPFRAWIWVGQRIGSVVSRILLTTLYFLILTPIAVIRRCVIRDPLELRMHLEVESYFHEKRIQSPKQLERMF